MGGGDASDVVIQLTDTQKAFAVAHSSTPGGDGPAPNILVVHTGAQGLRDVSQVSYLIDLHPRFVHL